MNLKLYDKTVELLLPIFDSYLEDTLINRELKLTKPIYDEDFYGLEYYPVIRTDDPEAFHNFYECYLQDLQEALNKDPAKFIDLLFSKENFAHTEKDIKAILVKINQVLEPNNYKVIGSNWSYKIILINENHIKLNQIPEDFKHLKEFQDEAYKEIEEGKYWEVVTKSRTIIEITLKEISNRFNLNYEGKDIVRDLNAVKTFFKMDAKNQDYPDYIKGLISATSSIVNNIAEARNKDSTAHAPRYKPKKHHAKFILESAISLSNFLISVMEYNTSNKKGK